MTGQSAAWSIEQCAAAAAQNDVYFTEAATVLSSRCICINAADTGRKLYVGAVWKGSVIDADASGQHLTAKCLNNLQDAILPTGQLLGVNVETTVQGSCEHAVQATRCWLLA